LKGRNGATAARHAQPWLDRAEERLGRSVQPLALIDRGEQEDYLSVFGTVCNLVRAKPTSEVLRQMRERPHKDRSFDFAHEDTAFTQRDQIMGQPSSTQILVANSWEGMPTSLSELL
jgi:hypothetical protein